MPLRPVYIERRGTVLATPYGDAAPVERQTETVWRPMCGSDPSSITQQQLENVVATVRTWAESQPPETQAAAALGSGPSKFDLVISPTTAWPAGAAEALAGVERYLESRFTDPVVVQINVGFAALGGTLGVTGVNYIQTLWPQARDALQADMDATDSIEAYLPTGATIPVRYNAASDTITNEPNTYVSVANYRAVIGVGGSVAASIVFNSNLGWDYTPPSVDPNFHSFWDVAIHEIGHALGFSSAVDTRTSDIEMADIYRFQLSDGSANYNPDSLGDFEITPRTVDRDPPAPGHLDDVVTDFIAAEYRMADGLPYQGSHFFPSVPSLYLMDPTFSTQETFYPNYLREADLAMFDAIGWDYPPENVTCPEALELECGVRHFDNSIAGGAVEPAFSCGDGSAHDGAAWFYFVASSTAARISTCGSAASDSTLAVYEGSCGSLVEIACSEHDSCIEPGLSTVCLTELVIGATYYVQVAGRTPADRGIYSLELQCSCDATCSDVCCAPADAPANEVGAVDRSRYISFVPGNAGRLTAIRVTLNSLHHPQPPNSNDPGPDFSAYEGQVRWVGPPQDYIDNTLPQTQFRAARLQCEPYFRDWSTEPLLLITGPEIIPSSAYEVQVIDEHCFSAGAIEDSYSEGVSASTSRWGDVAAPFQDPQAPTPTQPNILDVAALVDKIKQLPFAPPRVRAQLQPESPAAAATVNVIDLSNGVDALRNKAYPFPGPQPCP